jgi:biopolymer transport protein ExbD
VNLGGRRADDDPEINLISLIDVLFCLILFLVVTTTFNQRSMLKLQLPQAQATAKVEAGEPLVVLVDSEGKYYVGSSEVLKNSVADLKEAVIGMAGDRRDQAVVIRGDARAPYQAMITAMDALGQLGFTQIQLATTPEAKKQ